MPVLSDVQWIFVILVALYLFESLVWVRPGVVAFVSSWGGFNSRPRSRRLTGNDQGDLVLSGLGPFDVTLLAEALPLSTSSDGVVAFVAASPLQDDRPQQTGHWSAWEPLAEAVSQGRNVMLGDQLICATRSERTATHLAQRLRQIALCSEQERPQQIDAWRSERFDVTAVRRRIAAWQESTLAVRIGATLLLLWIGPVGISLFNGWLLVAPDMLVTILYVVILFGIWWLTALFGLLSHRYLYPAQRVARWKQLLYSLLSPAVPMRLADNLGRELLHFEHPLAVSAAVDSPDRFRAVAQQIVRDAAYPRMPEQPDGLSEQALAILRDSRCADLHQLRQIVADQGADHRSLLDAPARENLQSLSYCPRCLSDSVLQASQCQCCGNRPTVPYASGS